MIVGIVQARLGSRRLPGKVLADIAGRPMLWHVVTRVRQASLIDQAVVATSTSARDQAIADFCRQEGIACFRGAEEDVLDRYYRTAQHYGARTVVRITADCPLIDPVVIDRVIQAYLDGKHDYVTNTLRYTYPDGLDVGVFSFDALEKAWREADNPTHREHVTAYFRVSGRFSVGGVENENDQSHQSRRWTVDEPRDLEFVRQVYHHLYKEGTVFGMTEVFGLLTERPELGLINQDTVRNEGYYLSIARENTAMKSVPRQLVQTGVCLEKAKRMIPAQTQTFSKGPTQFVQGVSPAFLVRGQGARVWDVDGNEYLDYVMGLGSVVLGYDYPVVTEAVVRQVRDGTNFSLPHYLELELAELLVDLIPCAEMVRYGKNGSDVTTGAVRLARAYTGREMIACCGYHGWHDWYIGTTSRSLGVPKSTQSLTLTFQYNNIRSLEQLFLNYPDRIAVVIMEPVGIIKPENNFLAEVKEVAHKNGALLVFDEVVTGFRLALGGAQEFYGVKPDMACFGKAMANGFPLSALVGRRDIMKLLDEVFFSFTFGGEAVSLAAAIATIREMREKNVVAYRWTQGKKLMDGYNVLVREYGLSEYTRCEGLPVKNAITFTNKDGFQGLVFRSLLQQELVRRGILFLVGHNTCYNHNDADVEYTLRVYRAALDYIAKALESGKPEAFLKGTPVQPVFRKP